MTREAERPGWRHSVAPGEAFRVLRLLLQGSTDDRVRIRLDEHHLFAAVDDHDSDVDRRLSLRRKSCRPGTIGVDLISSRDRKAGNRPVQTEGCRARERSLSVQHELTRSRNLTDGKENPGGLERI